MVINRFLSIPTNETNVREGKFLKLVYGNGFTEENHSSKALTLDGACSSKIFMRINIRCTGDLSLHLSTIRQPGPPNLISLGLSPSLANSSFPKFSQARQVASSAKQNLLL